jgi:crotonobetainyl-CoA:carnitine CoA-transferase CaiB-like acyl-CoA transferase
MEFSILEFGSYLAGPLVGKHLVNFGCSVTAVVRPVTTKSARAEYERMKPMLVSLRSGKTCVELDLKSDAGRTAVQRLVRSADVIVENFGNGVMERLGLSYDQCVDWNPDVIYVSLPGYVRDDKEFAGVKAWDSIIMASTGVFSDMGLNRTLLGIKASYSSLPMPSVYASIFATFAILSALFDNRRGEYIQVPLASCLNEALVHNSIQFPLDDCYMNQRGLTIKNNAYPISVRELDSLIDPFFSKYVCGDGRPIYIVCPAHQRHQVNLLKALGLYDRIVAAVHIVNPYAATWERGIGSGNLDAEQAEFIRPLLTAKFEERTAQEWESFLGPLSIPVIAHKSTAEWKTSPHALDAGLVLKDDIAPMGWMAYRHEDSDENITLPWKDQTFRNIKVLDLCNVIAGPTIGAMLARMGADVTKVDIPIPTYAPEVTVIYGLVVNIGKRSVLLDIHHPKGRAALDDLIRQSDIILINCTEIALQRIHLSLEAIRAIQPGAILVRFDAWGGPINRGEYTNYVGYDDNVQAGIGIMERFGGGLNTAEEHAHIGTIDVIAGVAAAATAVYALILRKHRGIVGEARSSLVAVGQYLQYPFMFDAIRPQYGNGLACRGEHPLHACYDAIDGHFIIVAALHALDLEALIDRTCTLFCVDTMDEFKRIVKCLTINQVARRLVSTNDIQLMKLESLKRVCIKYSAISCRLSGPTYQFVVQDDHPIGSLTIVAPLAIRMRGIDTTLPFAPKYGTHTLEILSQIDASHLVIDNLASTSWSRNYMPFHSPCGQCGKRARLIILNCEHKLCNTCLHSTDRLMFCSVCNIPHEMSIVKLRDNYQKWKAAYNDWRRGHNKGSCDIRRMLRPDFCLRRTRSDSDLMSQCHVSLLHTTMNSERYIAQSMKRNNSHILSKP